MFVPFVSKGAFPGGRGRAQWPTSARTVPWPLRSDTTDELDSFPSRDEGPRAKHYDEYKEVLRALAERDNERLAYVAFTRAERGADGVRPLVGSAPGEAPRPGRLPGRRCTMPASTASARSWRTGPSAPADDAIESRGGDGGRAARLAGADTTGSVRAAAGAGRRGVGGGVPSSRRCPDSSWRTPADPLGRRPTTLASRSGTCWRPPSSRRPARDGRSITWSGCPTRCRRAC